MKRNSTYQAAKTVAVPIEEHFSKHILAAHERGESNIAPIPDAKVVEAIIDTTFWASMRREEGHSPKISLAYLPPETTGASLSFTQRIPLSSYMLTKLAPGVERPGIHLGVWHENDELYIWGTTLNLPDFCFVLDVSEPGLLVIKHRRIDGFGKFANVAVLIGDQIKFVDENSINLPDCPDILSSILGFTSPSYWNKSANVLVQLAVSMRAHGRGGALLIVPSTKEGWRESIIRPMNYSLTPPYSGLTEILKRQGDEDNVQSWQAGLKKEIDNIAGLTAIDGATIINDQHQLLAFGAKIGRLDGNGVVDKIFITEPILGGQVTTAPASKTGGTRHLSAAQFVYDQPDCLALVASQDGRFTVFSWSSCEKIVQAYRIDTLLL